MSKSRNVEPDYELMFDEQGGYVADFSDAFDMEEFENLGINPNSPTDAKPGSEDKVMMLAARYAAGMPLWHDEDCYDHAPPMTDEQGEEQFEEELIEEDLV
ncbi:MAG: hypothetical protein ACE37I_01160 [Rubinisphaera brasiliensis]|uniref:Uncharacterized protein n=1 Tax=Rubinisphaera brasiliensis (strain ATCC 49424 / DSM 5305 / JCM 21570 / IAM 15109 / NBRC 103401 / IFAM 1448) TaxID=756272 RepID=F0SSP1_RUBBR|nr:hypothetical protein [Rubinisphaera brasiliensis]ADY60357.1 hypothetical protein Plabr_2757 [Rubinisphaera brasiliensis DSM 5305]MBB03493.1 hypothetical protein [Planctomyces sp.]